MSKKIKSILKKNTDRHGTNKVYDNIMKRQERLSSRDEPIMNKKICVWINTYDRPDELDALLSDIVRDKEDFKIKVFIFNDCSKKDYTGVIKKYEQALDMFYTRETSNHGKKKYWKLCSKAIRKICSGDEKFDYFIKVDDDGRLVDRFIRKVINVWESIKDNKKLTLNFRVDSREGKKVWTNFKPRLMKGNKYPIYLSQWVDMDFICEKEMFARLGYRLRSQPERRWAYNPSRSSGTGEDISQRLVSSGFRLYMTTETLVIHDDHESIMNPEERKKNPLLTKKPNMEYGL